MAETKTNIPIEIKMGNAGTNNTNLPAFKEGSIIFTKDTKKIYIDPVGETERIAVGGTEVDLSGKQDKFGTVSYASSPKYLMLSINGYVDPTSGKFIQLSPSDITSTHINVTNPEISDKVKFNNSLIIGNVGAYGFDFELPTATTPGKIKTGSPGLNKLNFSNGLGTSDIQLGGIKTPTADNDAANKKYVDTQVANKQDKFAEYTSTRPSEEAPASDSTNILVLNEGKDFYLRDRATNPLVEFKINSSGALEGTTNYFSLTSKGAFNLKSNTFALSNDKDIPFQVVMDDSKKVVYYGLSGGDDNGSLYLTNTSRTGQQGATLQGNVSSDSRTTALVVNESNTKLLSWKQGTTTNNAPLLGVATPVATADTSKGITADDLDYQAANKKYVDDIKAELLNAINHPYTYDETTKELTLIL